jgi:hypothetical protein
MLPHGSDVPVCTNCTVYATHCVHVFPGVLSEVLETVLRGVGRGSACGEAVEGEI